MNTTTTRLTPAQICVQDLDLEQYKEVAAMGERLGGLLYFGDPWPLREGDETFETLEPQFMEKFEEIDIPLAMYVDTGCDYVTTEEPEFDERYYIEEDESYKECCCDLARQAYLNDMNDLFYEGWVKVSRREILTAWLGNACVDAISYSKFL